jgi:hypothetical protein
VNPRYWLGIDIGGTFTDFALFDTQTGELIGLKVPSTPPAFSEAVGVGLEQLADEHGVDLREIGTIAHGTTIAVNTLIQRTGARLGLLVTEGFRDVLELQRLRLPNPFDLTDRARRRWCPAPGCSKCASGSAPMARSTHRSTGEACRRPCAVLSVRTSKALSSRCSTRIATPLTSARCRPSSRRLRPDCR